MEAYQLPDLPAFASRPGHGVVVTSDGEVSEIGPGNAGDLAKAPHFVCHAGFSVSRLAPRTQTTPGFHFDLLELYAFTFPASQCLPTPKGIAAALGAPEPQDLEEEAIFLIEAANILLSALRRYDGEEAKRALDIARAMKVAGWVWAPIVLNILGGPEALASRDNGSLAVWTRLKDWEDVAPEGESPTLPVEAEEAQNRLGEYLGSASEHRPEQSRYAGESAQVFGPRHHIGHPNVLLAEAGTGIGKTLGYIAPSVLSSEKSGPSVWISTYTKNLQRQVDQEFARVFPDPQLRAEKVVIRKGRENYLCLLNYQESANAGRMGPNGVALGLIARWVQKTRDGDMVGGDFPAWLLPALLGDRARASSNAALATGLTDRRGECIYAACPHYRKCFIERAMRRSKHADIVIANHALVLAKAAVDLALEVQTTDEDEEELLSPDLKRLVFDEGHHLFDAADSTFSSHLTGLECAELRRWIRGPETRSRGRGLMDRVSDLTGESDKAEEALKASIQAALCLPSPGWQNRIQDGKPQGSGEHFLSLLRIHVLKAHPSPDNGFSIEAPTDGHGIEISEAASQFRKDLEELRRPLGTLARELEKRLTDEADTLDAIERGRIEGAVRGLDRRYQLTLPGWLQMLDALMDQTPANYTDWFAIDRAFGRDLDTGLHRHWIDPTIPLSAIVYEPAQSVLVTSATLRDQTLEADEEENDWASAETRTGALHLPLPAKRAYFPSPFDYGKQTRVIVVNDVARDNADQVSAAYRELFKASHGGALGIFTAINRLRGVYARMSEDLFQAGLPLYAQHVDPLDTGTLIDLFRAEENACLLGTDAVRDGVDVPGRALRLIVFDRVPWPTPSLIHKARRKAFGAKSYDDMIVRFKLKQAFGRLIRRQSDHGVFVMLDSRLPSRLLSAFPEDVTVERIGLSEAISRTQDFLCAQ